MILYYLELKEIVQNVTDITKHGSNILHFNIYINDNHVHVWQELRIFIKM